MSHAGTHLLHPTSQVPPWEQPRLQTWQRTERSLCIYQEISHSHYFVPIGLESLGVFGDSAMSFLKELAHRIRLKTADPQSFHHLCQTISVTIQRFNSVAILGSINNQSFVQ